VKILFVVVENFLVALHTKRKNKQLHDNVKAQFADYDDFHA